MTTSSNGMCVGTVLWKDRILCSFGVLLGDRHYRHFLFLAFLVFDYIRSLFEFP